MSYRNAIAAALVLGGVIVADMLVNDGKGLLFLLRKMVDLTIYVSFWR